MPCIRGCDRLVRTDTHPLSTLTCQGEADVDIDDVIARLLEGMFLVLSDEAVGSAPLTAISRRGDVIRCDVGRRALVENLVALGTVIVRRV